MWKDETTLLDIDDVVDFKRVWETVTESIPALRASLAPLLSEEGDN